MKQHRNIIVLACSALLSSSVLAGPPDTKQVAPAPPPPCEYGTGWYWGADAGSNVHQNVTGREDRNIDGDVLSFDGNSKAGFFGGLKLGYVFGRGMFRPTIEEDWFWNGFKVDDTARLNGVQFGQGTANIRSGAFMTNFLGRFAFGRFQPYLGGGIGGYYAKATDTNINVAGFVSHHGGDSGSLAWQGVAGADYYWTCKFSTFVEYKYLSYEALDLGNGNHHLGQQLIGAGIRFSF